MSRRLAPTDGPLLRAVLGPTNTGKTHLAIERMLEHKTGMIGFPLRLLAREVYETCCARVGEGAVALVTGEERRIPEAPRYWICTVEAMPLQRRVAFLALDEVQLATHPQRGHIFTDRILHARGARETMFMGADTMSSCLSTLLPGIVIERKPRFSTLTHVGASSLARLPRRSAVVAFSVPHVYELARRVRERRGGAAVVMGALSPRTRNAQVAMFQSGEVDTLVATDAIGMGLNLDLDHVAFAQLERFDGRRVRPLRPPELAQIAGRAGRHTRPGTFGTLRELGALSPSLVRALETHRFLSVERLQYRSSRLDFSELRALRLSLARPSPNRLLQKSAPALDELFLEQLSASPEVEGRSLGPDELRLLWRVCQVPDFRAQGEAHGVLLRRIFSTLLEHGRLDPAWLRRRVERLASVHGSLEEVMDRLSAIRIWSYVAWRDDWLDDPGPWRERAREIEDLLSDGLHERLLRRFAGDRVRSATGVALGGGGELVVADDGTATVSGAAVGRLRGFHFQAEERLSRTELSAVRALVRAELERRVRALADAPSTELSLGSGATLDWRGVPVARLVAGPSIRAPRIEVPRDTLLEAGGRQRVRVRLESWLPEALSPVTRLLDAPAAQRLEGVARGIFYRLSEGLGGVAVPPIRSQLRELGKPERRALASAGVRIGTENVFLAGLLKPGPQLLCTTLWSVWKQVEQPPEGPRAGAVSWTPALGADEGFVRAAGFAPLGPLAVRFDVLERLGAALRRAARSGEAFALDPAWMSWIGCSVDDLSLLVAALGYPRRAPRSGEPIRHRPKRRGAPRRGAGGRRRRNG